MFLWSFYNVSVNFAWTLTSEVEIRIQALETRCYRRFLNISYKDHVMNEEVWIQNATGVHDDLLVKKRKLRWYGHISKTSGMAKTILQGTVLGARRRGRQKKRWEDNIKEWTGMGFGDSLRAAEDRVGGNVLLQRHLWCPRSLISAFVFRCLDSIILLLAIAEISSLYLASLAAQASFTRLI